MTLGEAEAWIARMEKSAARGVTPETATMSLAEYGDSVWDLAMRGLEAKTLVPYSAGWRLRVVPALGHLTPQTITAGAADRVVLAWIAEEVGRSTVKNSLAALVRVMQQAVRDGLIDTNPARVVGWQQLYRQAEDEADDPRSLALQDWSALQDLAAALVDRSHGKFEGWGDVVEFAGGTAARIGEVSGVRLKDINLDSWIWDVCRQTTPSPGGLADKGTKGKRRRKVPIIPQIRPLVLRRVAETDGSPMARLFTGPRGGRITTAILRDATHWDEVVVSLGYDYLRRHDLRHTGLTWMADAGIPVHILRVIAGHGSIETTQRYLHSSPRTIQNAGVTLADYLAGNVSFWQDPEPEPPAKTAEPPSRGHLRLVQ
ncbi:site-specific integrase [Yinghuangia aomiensis]|uniref:Site-specific integrase n=1 Tax=Yinghuangia aomiensis TaxID=676205 RepID=A0ABP9I9A3_9ACTN